MGISNHYHFAWLCGALQQFEKEQAPLATLRQENRDVVLWCFGERRETPPIGFLRDTLGRQRTCGTFFDKFPTEPGVRLQDINTLENLPDNSCDVLTLFRASCFITDPPRFLSSARRLLKPGGIAIIDWLHGLSDAPVLDLGGDPRHGSSPTPFLTTYVDAGFLTDFLPEFHAFLRHVNDPPSWVNLERPGTPVPLRERIRRALGSDPRHHVSRGDYVETLRAELERAGKHLIEPGLMELYFKVVFRHARYFYPMVKKFNLYLLTALRPVGK